MYHTDDPEEGKHICGNFTGTWSPNLFIVDLFMCLYARALVIHSNVYGRVLAYKLHLFPILRYQAKKKEAALGICEVACH